MTWWDLLLRSSADSMISARLMRSPILPTIHFSASWLSVIISQIILLIESFVAYVALFFPDKDGATTGGLASQTWLIRSTDFLRTLVLVSAVRRITALSSVGSASRTVSYHRAFVKNTAAAWTASKKI